MRRYAAWAILGAFFLLSAAYTFTILPGNSPDEREHVEYVLYLSAHHTLPVWNWPSDRTTWQARQPPLYYSLEALVLQPFTRLPPLGQLRVMRLFSSLFHLAAIFLLWRLSLALYGDTWAALGPPLLLAALPQFTFIGASITNDAAANLFGALLLCATAVALAQGRRPAGWHIGLLGGLALLAKVSTLPIVCLCLAVVLLPPLIHKRRVGVESAAAVGLVVLLAGWFYVRNFLLYGDAVGIGARFQQYDPDRYTWAQLPLWWSLYFSSFWGRFGLMTQPMSLAAYAEAAALSAAALAGWIHAWDRLSGLPGRRFLLAALALAVAQNFTVGFFMSYQPQARFTFIAAVAWAVLAWDGLRAAAALFPEKKRPRLLGAGAALLLFLNIDAFLHL